MIVLTKMNLKTMQVVLSVKAVMNDQGILPPAWLSAFLQRTHIKTHQNYHSFPFISGLTSALSRLSHGVYSFVLWYLHY